MTSLQFASDYLSLLNHKSRDAVLSSLSHKAAGLKKERYIGADAQANIDVLRLDQIHSLLSGNKYFKLAPYLALAKQLGKKRILSFGGPYSNHIYALSAACRKAQLESVLVIRGGERETPTMRDARLWGSKLHPCSRKQYRDKYNSEFLYQLEQEYGDFLFVPEGGGGTLGAWGAQAIAQAAVGYQAVCLAAGTGSTAAGVITGLSCMKVAEPPEVIVVPVLKASKLEETDLQLSIEEILRDLSKCNSDDQAGTQGAAINWALHWGHDGGGYGKCSKELKHFIETNNINYQLALDPIYTAKAFQAMLKIIASRQEKQPAGLRKVLFIHTGGMQGCRGYKDLAYLSGAE